MTATSTLSLGEYSLHTEELTEVDLAERENDWVAVLGKAWPLSTGQIPPSTTSVARSLLNLTQETGWVRNIDEALYDLGGRYAVLAHVGGSLTAYNDACGTRSVYYSTETGDVASHFALVRHGLPDKSLQQFEGNDHRDELSWDRTRSPHVRALVPNHRITLLHGESGEQERYFPLTENRGRALSSDERISTIQRLWNEQLQAILSAEHPKAISITAGLDSRTILATALEKRDEFVGFTYTSTEATERRRPSTRWSRSGQADFHGVQLLKPFLPQRFRFLAAPADRDSDPNNAWIAAYRGILDRNSGRSHNRRLLPRYMELFPDPRTMHYSGNLLKIGRLPFRATGDTRERAFEVLISKLAREAGIDVDRALREAHSGAGRMGYGQIPLEYDLTDIFYWEQRQGRWFSQVASETDVAFDTVTPFNARRVIDLFLAYSLDDRSNTFAQSELIYRSAPLLTFAGLNGEPDLYRKHVSQGVPQDDLVDPNRHGSIVDTNRSANGNPTAFGSERQPAGEREAASTTHDTHYRVPSLRHSGLESLEFGGYGTAVHRIDLSRNRRLDFYAKLQSSDTLFVSLHGAVPLSAPRYPHFRRVESMKNKVSALLCIADPTLALSEDADFRLAWYAGSPEWDPIDDLARLVKEAQLYVGATRVMFLGGSGGGFASLRLATRFSGSMAFVQDPQSDVARYYPAHIDRLFDAAWTGWSPQGAFTAYPERFNLLHLYSECDHDAFIYYRQSNGDEWHKVNHAKPFEEAVLNTEGYISGKFLFIYEDPAKPGHGAITPAEFDHHLDAAIKFWDSAV